jgi:hypothetical protein
MLRVATKMTKQTIARKVTIRLPFVLKRCIVLMLVLQEGVVSRLQKFAICNGYREEVATLKIVLCEMCLLRVVFLLELSPLQMTWPIFT